MCNLTHTHVTAFAAGVVNGLYSLPMCHCGAAARTHTSARREREREKVKWRSAGEVSVNFCGLFGAFHRRVSIFTLLRAARLSGFTSKLGENCEGGKKISRNEKCPQFTSDIA